MRLIFMPGMAENYRKGEKKMTQEQFENLGIEKGLAKKAAEESKKELEGYVPKDTYDTAEQQRKQLETSVNDYKTQLETLKASAGDNEELKTKRASGVSLVWAMPIACRSSWVKDRTCTSVTQATEVAMPDP